MVDEKVHERVPVSQHRNAAAAADGKTHRFQLDTERERQREQTGEDTEGWLGTQHQREREKFLNPHPCHTEKKVGGRLSMVIFFLAGGVCILQPAFVHLPKVTLAGCKALPRLMRDQQPVQCRAISIAKKPHQNNNKKPPERNEKEPLSPSNSAVIQPTSCLGQHGLAFCRSPSLGHCTH